MTRLADCTLPFITPDELMGSSLIEVDLVFPSQRIEVSVAKQENVVEHLAPRAADKTLRHRIHVGRSHCDLDDLRPAALRHSVKPPWWLPFASAENFIG
jgi:hypothetical protein